MCDFLVSAMLAMFAGMSPQGEAGTMGRGSAIIDRGSSAIVLAELRRRSEELEATRQELREAQSREGFSQEREAQLRALANELAETLSRTELLERKIDLNSENAGALSPAQLQEALLQEIRKRTLAGVQKNEAEAELHRLRGSLQTVSGNLATLNTNFAVSQQQLADTRTTLQEREVTLKQTDEELVKTREVLSAKQTELSGVRTTLESELTKLAQTREEAQKLMTNLSFAQGKLSVAEHDLAQVRGQSERNRKLAEQREVEMREVQRQLEDAKKMLKNAVTELSRTKAALDQSQDEVTRTVAAKAQAQGKADTAQAKLEATERELRSIEDKLRSDVLERYDAAIVRLTLSLNEKRLLLDQKGGGVYFLPLITIAGKTVMPGFHKQLFGDESYALNFHRIDRLEYRVNVSSAPQDQAGTLLHGPLLLLPDEPKIAAIEFSIRGRQPLAALTIDVLKQRGLEDLFLFKAGSFGKESASLNGRCSLDLGSGEPQLYIRNLGRGSAGELKAEPGDFIITKQGDFVGVVIGMENFDMGRRQEAKCFVFPTGFTWDGAKMIQLDKAPESEYFDGFSQGVREIRAGYDK
jgi:chromosome segregation ATPase